MKTLATAVAVLIAVSSACIIVNATVLVPRDRIRGHQHDSLASRQGMNVDEEALLEFKANLRDAQGALRNWNATAVGFCEWKGVICNSQGSVTHLNLVSLELEGGISPALGRLSSLLVVDLSYNNFTGSLPQELGNCSFLRRLHIGYNQLTGALPSSIGFLRELKSLSLRANNLSMSIPTSLLTNASKLSVLDLSQNSFTGRIPQELGLQYLQALKLQQNELSGPVSVFLRNSSSLRYLYLSSNQLSGNLPHDAWLPPGLLSLRLSANNLNGEIPSSVATSSSGLLEIDLSKNDFAGAIPPEVGRLSSLTTLYLYANHLEGSIPASLGNCTSLQMVDLSKNNFTGSIPTEMGRLRRLQELSLSTNYLTGGIPTSLGNCSSLRSLDLSENGLDGPIPVDVALLAGPPIASFQSNELSGDVPSNSSAGLVAGLQVISLFGNNLQGEIPAALGNGLSLRLLNLGQNRLGGVIPPGLGRLVSLHNLQLHGNQLTGFIPNEFGSLRSVQVMDLSLNHLSGVIPASLGSCKALERLDLSNNILNGSIPTTLGNIRPLYFLNVSNNNLQGPIPDSGVFANLTAASFRGNAGLCGILVGRLCFVPGFWRPQSSCTGLRCGRWIIVLAVGSFLLAVAGAIAIFLIRRGVGAGAFKGGSKYASASQDLGGQRRQFSAAELGNATNQFHEGNIVGSGARGTVYRGVMPDGLVIAVKILKDNHGEKDVPRLLQELKALKRIRHRNLLSILGECLNPEMKAVVFEFMANGSLDKHLHGSGACLLGWDQRLNIAIGVAQGLVFLHHEYHDQVIHCDLKPSNILLDLKLEAKVADFGMSTTTLPVNAGEVVATNIRGTTGYIPPEYGPSTAASVTGDVYSFGVVLLELASGQKPTSLVFGEGMTVVSFARSAYPDRWESLLDAELLSELPSKARGMKLFLQIALLCTHEAPSERPSMKTVLELLQLIQRLSSSDRMPTSPLRTSPAAELPTLDALNARIAEVLLSSSGRSSNHRPSTNSRLSSSPSLPHSNEMRATIDQNLHPDPECHEP